MTTRCFTVVFKCSPSLFKVENFFCCINLLWSVTLRWKTRFTVIYRYILHLNYSTIIHPQAFESKHCFITQLEVTGYFMVLDISVSRLCDEAGDGTGESYLFGLLHDLQERSVH